MKGILLAGGKGSRLDPITRVVSKQLLPIYDKPMLYYPLANLMMANVTDVLVISSPHQIPLFQHLFGDGSQWGLNINYGEQATPEGIAHALIVGSYFVEDDDVFLILGDNLLHGELLEKTLMNSYQRHDGATIFAYRVEDPTAFGVVEINEMGKAVSIQEKPLTPRSPFAVPGLYIYDSSVMDVARNLRKSDRGEYEITDVNIAYMEAGKLSVCVLDESTIWLDTGTHDSMLEASNYVQKYQNTTGRMIGCIDEISLGRGFIDESQFETNIHNMPNVPYKSYLEKVLRNSNEG